MSNQLALANQFAAGVASLQRREPVEIRMPNGTVVTAIPEEIEIETNDGTGRTKKIMEISVLTQGVDGPIEIKARMSHETYDKQLVKAHDRVGRLAAVQERVIGRLGQGR